ncbi:MAG: hypothetical protein A2927_00110 [Candidatus Komeilibacteria bacterium RIFCSPLOWO2_01_FULL_45_10]|uniref:dolichyl-phosphate beta-glucosyltransferase n=1 Tax=Candidatus Komeilibacteria bacterium RIFCSPLOWO2_01_FULL_45_10 TaxID=1798550 RepID=A0A1G2BKE2_9BACT|nr:MAG: hypothetical protein A2927_00110 [Candidatus Komeilibacteria bacterium RIFCSPLOWO2_01_FULL_45_10]
MKISVIIPVFNEEKVIASALEAIYNYLNRQRFFSDFEVIIVNDGSTDNTLAIIENQDYPSLKIINQPVNLGKGAAVKAGMENASGGWQLFLDADYSTPITEVEKILPFLNQADIFIGSRALKDSEILLHQPIIKEWLGKLGNAGIGLFLGLPFKDTQCGFKLFSRKSLVIFKKQTLRRWGFDFELLFLAKKYGLTVKEIAINWTNNQHSKVKKIDYLKTFFELLKIYFNNLTNKYDI